MDKISATGLWLNPEGTFHFQDGDREEGASGPGGGRFDVGALQIPTPFLSLIASMDSMQSCTSNNTGFIGPTDWL